MRIYYVPIMLCVCCIHVCYVYISMLYTCMLCIYIYAVYMYAVYIYIYAVYMYAVYIYIYAVYMYAVCIYIYLCCIHVCCVSIHTLIGSSGTVHTMSFPPSQLCLKRVWPKLNSYKNSNLGENSVSISSPLFTHTNNIYSIDTVLPVGRNVI